MNSEHSCPVKIGKHRLNLLIITAPLFELYGFEMKYKFTMEERQKSFSHL